MSAFNKFKKTKEKEEQKTSQNHDGKKGASGQASYRGVSEPGNVERSLSQPNASDKISPNHKSSNKITPNLEKKGPVAPSKELQELLEHEPDLYSEDDLKVKYKSSSKKLSEKPKGPAAASKKKSKTNKKPKYPHDSDDMYHFRKHICGVSRHATIPELAKDIVDSLTETYKKYWRKLK